VGLIWEKKIILQPKTQRKFKNKLGAELIESILIKMPIPPVYLFRYSEGQGVDKKEYYEVLDGQQRLATLISFRKGKHFDSKLAFTTKKFPYKIKNALLSDINGKTYDELGDFYKGIFDDTCISCIEISIKDELSSIEAKKAIFSKINKKTTVLSKIEINNCLYDGKVFDEIRNLSTELLGTKYNFFNTSNDKYEVEDFLLKFLVLVSNKYWRGNINADIVNMLENEKDSDEYVDKVKKIRATFRNVREILGIGTEWMNTLKIKYLFLWLLIFFIQNFINKSFLTLIR